MEDNYDPNDAGDAGYNSPKEIDLANMEKDVENEDMLAITQHNQQQIVRNAQLDRVSEQHTYRENATDRHTKSVSNNDSMPQIKVHNGQQDAEPVQNIQENELAQ